MSETQPVTFSNSFGLNLRGLFSEASEERILLLAHGFMSDKSAHGRFAQVTELANHLGWSTLAFDFSGCGESDDAPITVERETDDFLSALELCRSHGYRKFAFLGNSLGVRSCLHCADQDPVTMILIGGAMNSMLYNWSDYFTAVQLEELRLQGRTEYPVDRAGRTRCLITKETLSDFANFDKEAIFKQLRCPVLLIYGDQGWEESTLLDKARQSMHLLPVGSALQVIPGEEHGCRGRFDLVLRHIESWLLLRQ